MKPDAQFCPSRVTMRLVPVGGFSLPGVDLFRSGRRGVDLSAAVRMAAHTCYAVRLGRHAMQAEPAEYAVLEPPAVAESFAGRHRFHVARGGLLRGIAGYFDAELAPDVVLSTGPGVDTHWGQYLFAVPPVQTQPGDELDVDLSLRSGAWHWSVRVSRRGVELLQHRARSSWPDRQPVAQVGPWQPDREAARQSSDRATQKMLAGQLDDAAAAYQQACWALGPDDDDLACTVFENLGLAAFNQGRWGDATDAFLRALDGDLTSREQALRFLVVALHHRGEHHGLGQALTAYEAHFGPHPSGLRAAPVVDPAG
jgi:tetratricopeptide (TPR) repeat protein